MFECLAPDWLWCLPLVAGCAAWCAWRRRQPGQWARHVEPALLQALQVKGGGPRRWLDPLWLLAFDLGLGVLALAQPVWHRAGTGTGAGHGSTVALAPWLVLALLILVLPLFRRGWLAAAGKAGEQG